MRSSDAPRSATGGQAPVPGWIVFGALALMGWGGWYLGTYSGGFRSDVYDTRVPTGADVATTQLVSAVDPMILGRRVYQSCAACHQQDGLGVPGVYPPLAQSEWVVGRPDAATRIVLHGVRGPLEVAGVTYDQPMPSWNVLKDDRLAAVLTYIRSSWGNEAEPVTAEAVAAIRRETSGRRRAWTAVELKALPQR